MDKQPLVSVIMPCYNHGDFIEAAVDSVKQQPYTNTEIIIVDDGSTDEKTLQVLNGLKNSVTVIHQPNQGPSVARNTALKAVKGEYVLCLDSDNRVRPNTISNAVDILDRDSGVGVVYGDGLYFGDSNDRKVQEPFDIKAQLLHSRIDVCSVIRKKVFDDVGGFDEYMSKKGLEDWDFFIGVYAKGWKLVYTPEITFDYRVAHASSRTHQVANKNLDDLKRYVWQKHIALLANRYEELYHLNKNAARQPEFRIGSLLLSPYRLIMSFLRRK